MEDEGFDSLEQLNEYKSVASQTFLREEDFYDFYNQYTCRVNHKNFMLVLTCSYVAVWDELAAKAKAGKEEGSSRCECPPDLSGNVYGFGALMIDTKSSELEDHICMYTTLMVLMLSARIFTF
ncbi:unnamed protein product [Urochloa humidicola]